MAVTNDMSADRRVMRHAATLREAGHEVVVVCRESDTSRRAADGIALERIAVRHSRGWRFYAEYNIALSRKLRSMDADVLWANDTDTLLGCWLARKGRRLVMDVHEIFPEVPEIIHKPLVKRVWATVERLLMPKCDALLTVNGSLADYYRQKLGVEMTVVRNLPATMHPDACCQEDCENYKSPMLLYQGCVNLGRGVDWAIDALEWLPECTLVVAGRGDLLDEMKAYAAAKPWADRIHFLGHVQPERLAALTRKASVGLVMLEDMGMSYHYALPNRVGDFVVAGVPMVVSDLPEMAGVVRRFGVGEVIGEKEGMTKSQHAKALSEAVHKVLAREWHEGDFDAAKAGMDWEKEKQGVLRACDK